MSKQDLVLVAGGTPATPRSVGATTIPGLLEVLHAEWDSLMLEQFSLRQQLATAQQELSQALFQYDAACRVIAKLVKERDSLKKASRGDAAEGDSAEPEQPQTAVPQRVADEIDANAHRLKAARRKREISRTVVLPAKVSQMAEAQHYECHTSSTGPAAVHCIAVAEDRFGKTIFSGGSDAKAIAYDLQRRAVVGTMVGHTKPIRGIAASADFVVTCSDDSSTRVWRSENGKYTNFVTGKGHSGCVTGIAVLPSDRQALTGGSDGMLLLCDLSSGLQLATGKAPESSLGINCVALHPDGFLSATGCGTTILLWDIKMMHVELALPTEELGSVGAVAFSENGYTMVVGTANGTVQQWDLRKPNDALHSLTLDDMRAPINRVSVDESGQYLAIASNDLKIWSLKEERLLNTLSNHVGPVTDVSWGVDAQWLCSSSLDRQVKIYTEL